MENSVPEGLQNVRASAAMPPPWPWPSRPGREPHASRYTPGHRQQSHSTDTDNTQRTPATGFDNTQRQAPGNLQRTGKTSRIPASFLQSTLPKRRSLCPGCSCSTLKIL